MVNYRKHFNNEELQQETEFNVCMKSQWALAGPDAWHILTFPFVYKCLVKNGCCEIDTHREWIWHVNIQKLSSLTFMYCSMAPDKFSNR